MGADPVKLYSDMLFCRAFEELAEELWNLGRISGEMHLARGEEALVAGVLDHLRPEDAMALDHRGTAPMLLRGIDPELLLKEFLGHEDGLCGGRGGHMHLYSPQTLSASSGIVGASGPAAAGFGLAAQMLRSGSVAIAFLGEGALNQGMMMESMNLAAVWKLPVIFVCKNNDWAITTRSDVLTGGNPLARAQGLGLPTDHVDGTDAIAVWDAAGSAIDRARNNGGPAFLQCDCPRLAGHFLGDHMVRLTQNPMTELPTIAGTMVRQSLKSSDAGILQRVKAVSNVTGALGRVAVDGFAGQNDPLPKARRAAQRVADLSAMEDGIADRLEALRRAAGSWKCADDE